MSKTSILILSILATVIIIVIFDRNKPKQNVVIPQTQTQTPTTNESKDIPLMTIIAENLEVPWALAFLPASPSGGPDGSILATERRGRVRLVNKNGILSSSPIAVINVLQKGESGLHGIAIHPDFSKNHFIYLYYTYEDTGDQTLNRVSRFVFDGKSLAKETIIINAIPGAPFHDGGRIKFGPDGFLYITTGDAQNPSLAQDLNSLAGKTLRVTDNGEPAPGNPFDSKIYSYGHRNSQGLAWDGKNRLWATEHGPLANDELNLIEKGKNYGWPVIQGNDKQKGMETPFKNSGLSTWAPSGTAYLDGSIFFAGLRGQTLFEYNVESKTLTSHLKGEIGRIRDVVIGPDNLLYITTSNRDSRGSPKANDDKIIRLNPKKLSSN